MRMRKWGRKRRDTRRAAVRPSPIQVGVAAGWFEGEGHARWHRTTEQVLVYQKRPWMLHKMVEWFGGSIRPNNNGAQAWSACGSRARGFLMTIYSLLSPYRQEQVRRTLERGRLYSGVTLPL